MPIILSSCPKHCCLLPNLTVNFNFVQVLTFNGLVESLKKLQLSPEFEIRCDRRHLAWFHRFWENQEIKSTSNDQHSSALFVLRSARLLWREGEGKGDPWNIHSLYLQCSVETDLWTQEGTKQIQELTSLSHE